MGAECDERGSRTKSWDMRIFQGQEGATGVWKRAEVRRVDMVVKTDSGRGGGGASGPQEPSAAPAAALLLGAGQLWVPAQPIRAQDSCPS